MKKIFRNHLFCCMALLVTLSPLSASATVIESFTATVVSGAGFVGNQYFGTFSYDETVLTGTGSEELIPTFGDVTIDFIFEGQSFNETHDTDFDDFPQLNFEDGDLSSINFLLDGGANGVDFTDPSVVSVFVGENLTSPAGIPGYTVDAFVTVPEPTTLALLLFCFTGAAFSKRNKSFN